MNFSQRTPTNKVQKTKVKQNQGSIIGARVGRKPVVHRIFEDAADYAEDSYWKERLLLAARNEFGRKNISYDGKVLKKVKKRGVEKAEIRTDDPEEAMNVFIDFYKKYNGVLSKTDIEKNKEKARLASESKIDIEWDRCTKKMRYALVTEYSNRMAQMYGLDDGTREILALTLCLLVSYSLLSEEEVLVENNEVTEISEVIFDEGDHTFCLTDKIREDADKKLSANKKKVSKTKKVNPSDVTKAWEMSLNHRKEMLKKAK